MKTAAAETRLRIALLVDRFGKHFGGAEGYGVELARVLAQRHDVTVIARDYHSDLQLPYLPIRVSRRLPSWIRVLYFAWRASRLTANGRFDIVHSHMNGWCGQVQVMHVTPVRYKYQCGVGCLARLATWFSPRLATYLLLERARVRPESGRKLVAVSGLIVEQMRQAYGDLPLAMIPPGVSPAEPLDAERRSATRARCGCGPDSVLCLLVARNPLRKGLQTLLQALDGLGQNCQLVIVGVDQSTREAIARHPKLATSVSLVEPTSNVGPYYEAADLYVHPTLNDSFGLAPLEAMAHRLPVIISAPRYCGFAAYLTQGESAWLLPDPRDVNQLRHAIATLAMDLDLRQKLAAGGHAIACKHSWHAVAMQYETLYRDVLAKTRADKAPVHPGHIPTIRDGNVWRPQRWRAAEALSAWLARVVRPAASSRNDENDQTRAINQPRNARWHIYQAGNHVEAWREYLAKAVIWALMALVIAMLIWI